MKSLLVHADAVVRGDLRLTGSGDLQETLRLPAMIVLFGGLYGAVMGTFGGIGGERILMVFFSAIKVPLLLLVTFALSLPSYFIVNALTGLRDDFGDVLRALLASQAGMTILLFSLAPLTLLWNVTTTDHQEAILFNALMFGIATGGGQMLLRRNYRLLIARDPRHRQLLRFWGAVYTFVGIQMGWVLRPFVGDPRLPVGFFRADSWGNAYVAVFTIVRHVLPH